MASVLAELMASGESWTGQTVAERVQTAPALPAMKQEQVDLGVYDSLLQEVRYDAA